MNIRYAPTARGGRLYSGEFRCLHCRQVISVDLTRSRVHNRNHCPYCLYSRHLDLYEAGDRLAACKEKMQPVALTIKKTRKKYGSGKGEIMLIHQCVDCGTLSINRIAADDDAATILDIFRSSIEYPIHALCEGNGIAPLRSTDSDALHRQLFGGNKIPVPVW